MIQEYINFVKLLDCDYANTIEYFSLSLLFFDCIITWSQNWLHSVDLWIKLLLVMITHLCLFWTQNTTEVDFLTMVEAPGDNPAKQAMNKFITDNTVIFDAFKWSTRKFVTKKHPTTYSQLTCMHATFLLFVIAWWIPMYDQRNMTAQFYSKHYVLHATASMSDPQGQNILDLKAG